MTFEVLFPPEFVQALLALMAAIALDLILGIAVAIKFKTFDLKKLADFYTSSVIPNLIGWGGSDVVLRLAAASLNVPLITTLSQIGITALYGLAAASLVGAIVDKLAKLKAPVPEPAETVTMTVTLPTPQAPTPTVSASDEMGRDLPVTPQDGPTGQ